MAGAGDIMLGALQRRDGSIETVLCHSSQCILYNFNTFETKWVKTEIEGHLFVFKRSKSPHIGFTLMNTKNQENLTEILTPDIGLQLNCPCLLYKNTKGIYALWFQEKSDAERIFNFLKRHHPIGSEPGNTQNASLTQNATETKKSSSNSKSGSPSIMKQKSSYGDDSFSTALPKNQSRDKVYSAHIGGGSSSILSMLYAADSKSRGESSDCSVHNTAAVSKIDKETDACSKEGDHKHLAQDQRITSSPPSYNSSNSSNAETGYLKTSANSAFGPPVPSYCRSLSESGHGFNSLSNIGHRNPESSSRGSSFTTLSRTGSGKISRDQQVKDSESNNYISQSQGSQSSSPWGQQMMSKGEKPAASVANEEMPLLLQQMFSQTETKSPSSNQKQQAQPQQQLQQALFYSPQLRRPLSTTSAPSFPGVTPNKSATSLKVGNEDNIFRAETRQSSMSSSSSPNGGGGISSRVQQLFSVDHTVASFKSPSTPQTTFKLNNSSNNSALNFISGSASADAVPPNSTPAPQGFMSHHTSHNQNAAANPIHLAPQSFSPHPSSENFLKTATAFGANTDDASLQHDMKPCKGNINDAKTCCSLSGDIKIADFNRMSSLKMEPQSEGFSGSSSGDQMVTIDNHAFNLSEETLQALHLMPPSQFLSDEDDCSSSAGSPPSRASFSCNDHVNTLQQTDPQISTSSAKFQLSSSLDSDSNGPCSNAGDMMMKSFNPQHYPSSLQALNPNTAPLQTRKNTGGVNLAMSMPTVFSRSQNPTKLNPNGSSSPVFEADSMDPELLVASRQQNDTNTVEFMLTVDQMQQAMIHLLQTDSTFVQKLHHAYVQSLHQPSNRNHHRLMNGWHEHEK